MKNPYVLAFDCSTPIATVALNTTRCEVAHGKQAALLVPTIEALMARKGIRYADLDCMVTTIGPGSFTGLRIALAALHGLSLASGVPVKTLTAAEAVAWGQPDGHFVVALNAGKGEAFLQTFVVTQGIPHAQDAIQLHPQDIIHRTTLPCYSNLWATDHTHYVAGPDAAVLTRIAHYLPVGTLADAMPYYIRDADAKIPAQPAWLATRA